jgi:TPP-dependent pyruvate/acetoin dehydrogenase alpha subunit
VREQVTQAREAVSAAQPPGGEEMFDVVYAAPPPGIEAQKREWRAAGAEPDA